MQFRLCFEFGIGSVILCIGWLLTFAVWVCFLQMSVALHFDLVVVWTILFDWCCWCLLCKLTFVVFWVCACVLVFCAFGFF